MPPPRDTWHTLVEWSRPADRHSRSGRSTTSALQWATAVGPERLLVELRQRLPGQAGPGRSWPAWATRWRHGRKGLGMVQPVRARPAPATERPRVSPVRRYRQDRRGAVASTRLTHGSGAEPRCRSAGGRFAVPQRGSCSEIAIASRREQRDVRGDPLARQTDGIHRPQQAFAAEGAPGSWPTTAEIVFINPRPTVRPAAEQSIAIDRHQVDRSGRRHRA